MKLCAIIVDIVYAFHILFQFILKPALSTSHRKELHCLSFLFQHILVYFKSGKYGQFPPVLELMTKEALSQIHVSNQNASFHVAEVVNGCE